MQISAKGPSRRCGCGETLTPASTTTNRNGGVQLTHHRCAKCGAAFSAASGDHLASLLISAGSMTALAIAPWLRLVPNLPEAMALGVSAVGGVTAAVFWVRAARVLRVWSRHPIVRSPPPAQR